MQNGLVSGEGTTADIGIPRHILVMDSTDEICIASQMFASSVLSPAVVRILSGIVCPKNLGAQISLAEQS